MEASSFWVSLAALVVAALSYIVARAAWRETNRPIVTVRVATCGTGLGDSMSAAPLNLVVENTGNRPAKNLRLEVNEAALAAALAKTASDDHREEIRACFSSKFGIPILPNGMSASSAFGLISYRDDNDWEFHSRIPISIRYEDLEGRKFKHSHDLFVADNSGFASAHWGGYTSQTGTAAPAA